MSIQAKPTVEPMSARRIGIAHLTIGVILSGSLYCIATDSEYWPFSQYEMYSELAMPGHWSQVYLFGIKDSDPPREVPFKRRGYLRPFDWIRLKRAFERLEERPDGRAHLREALSDLLVRYETRRQAGAEQGSRFLGLRLYRYTWHDVQRDRPHAMDQVDRKDLLVEVWLPAGVH